jgi:hypothetical protein
MENTDQIREEYLKEYVQKIKQEYPVLFSGGKEAEDAFQTVVARLVSSTEIMTRAAVGDEVLRTLATMMDGDLENLENSGLCDEHFEILAEDPEAGFHELLGLTYQNMLIDMNHRLSQGISTALGAATDDALTEDEVLKLSMNTVRGQA